MKPYYVAPREDGRFDISMRQYRSNDYAPLKNGPFSQADKDKMVAQFDRAFAWGEADDWAGWM